MRALLHDVGVRASARQSAYADTGGPQEERLAATVEDEVVHVFVDLVVDEDGYPPFRVEEAARRGDRAGAGAAGRDPGVRVRHVAR